jgi:hypothetical protein
MTVIGTYNIGPGTYNNFRIRVPYGNIILTGNITFTGGDAIISSQNGNISTINANITLQSGTNGATIPEPFTYVYSKRSLSLSVGNGTIDVGNINAAGSYVFLYNNRAGNLYGTYTSTRSSNTNPAITADYLLFRGLGRLLNSTVSDNSVKFIPSMSLGTIAFASESGSTFEGRTDTGDICYRLVSYGNVYEQIVIPSNLDPDRFLIPNATVNGYNSSFNSNFITTSKNPTVKISTVNSVFGLGNNLSTYRGVTWYEGTTLTGTFPSTNLRLVNFLGKRGVYGNP